MQCTQRSPSTLGRVLDWQVKHVLVVLAKNEPSSVRSARISLSDFADPVTVIERRTKALGPEGKATLRSQRE